MQSGLSDPGPFAMLACCCCCCCVGAEMSVVAALLTWRCDVSFAGSFLRAAIVDSVLIKVLYCDPNL